MSIKLATFMRMHLDEIVAEFVDFARAHKPASVDISVVELRDHASDILLTIATGLESGDTREQRHQKSLDHLSETASHQSAAALHGAQRQASGFTLPQLTAEYRALRASVLRLWLPTVETFSGDTADEIARFHEGVDQALQESAIRYAQRTNRARDTFLAILGHDLRSPLATMSMAGNLLTREDGGNERTRQMGHSVKRSAATMTTMVNDLLEYARTELGGKIPVKLARADLRSICQAAVDEVAVALPECEFELTCAEPLVGDFDSPRLAQVFSNLLNNAAQYRGDGRPVSLTAAKSGQQFSVAVTNFGDQIPSASLRAIFDPLVQLSVSPNQKGPASTSLGLGLFIAREITLAHGGAITVASDTSSGTVFTVWLPEAISAPAPLAGCPA